jgi:hypothetical protein
MSLTRKAAAATAMALSLILFLAAQQPADLVGTWSGEATLEGMDEPNTMTLVLALKEDGKLAGRMTDQYGTVDSEIKDIVLEQGAFNFTVPVMLPQGGQGNILFKMKLSSDGMKGEIEIPEMSAKGTWQATKQK